jgi:hypothetical protein
MLASIWCKVCINSERKKYENFYCVFHMFILSVVCVYRVCVCVLCGVVMWYVFGVCVCVLCCNVMWYVFGVCVCVCFCVVL